MREFVKKAVERGNVTAQEYHHMRLSGEEWIAIIPALSFEALESIVNDALKRARPVVKAFSSVAPIVENWAPELLRRIKQQLDDNDRCVLVRAMQAEINTLKDQLEHVNETVSYFEVMEMLGENRKKITGAGSLSDRIRLLAGRS